MNIIEFIHLLIVLFIVGIPFLPKEILKTAIYLPALIALSWLLLGGCFITQQNGTDSESFIHTLLQKVVTNITTKQSDNLITLTMILITLFGSKKLGGF